MSDPFATSDELARACVEQRIREFPPQSFFGAKYYSETMVRHLILTAHMQGYTDAVRACTVAVNQSRLGSYR